MTTTQATETLGAIVQSATDAIIPISVGLTDQVR